VIDGNSSNHTFNRLPDRDAPLPKGSVKLRCTYECYLSHGEEDKIGKIVLRFYIVYVRSDVLELSWFYIPRAGGI
jgi:hypothetical protein